MIELNELKACKAQSGERPFDVGYESVISHQTLFDCPYGHTTEQDIRRRHEWLNGYLTALANINCVTALI